MSSQRPWHKEFGRVINDLADNGKNEITRRRSTKRSSWNTLGGSTR